MNASGDLLGARRLRELLVRHGVRPSKGLSQNFVVDPNTIRRVVAVASVEPGDHVLEIGAGAGSLTVGLAHAAGRVTAIEVDRTLAPVLDATTGSLANVEVIFGDALELPLAKVGATKLVANLPYAVATAIVFRVLEQSPSISELTVMTQREVGERYAAGPGSKIYGQTSVMARYWADVRIVSRISRRAFYPVPNVDSVLVHMTRTGSLPAPGADLVRAVVRAAFSQRRKMLRNTLAPLAGGPDRAADALRAAGLDPDARAEDVSLQGFVALASLLHIGSR